MTNLITQNFRLSFCQRFLCLTNLFSNCISFLLCLFSILSALFYNETRKQRSLFYILFVVYFVYSLLECFDDVQNFTIDSC